MAMRLWKTRIALVIVPLLAAACPETEEADEAPVEERHVVLSECGLELACDPMRHVLDYHPQEAFDCAAELWAAGGAGRLQVTIETDGDPYTVGEQALVLLSDGQILRQVRDHELGELEDVNDDRWLAWGPHELCENVNETFAPEANFVCQAVSDWTCEDLVASTTEG